MSCSVLAVQRPPVLPESEHEVLITDHSGHIFTDLSPTSILHVIQMSRVFPDSKTFVDMKLMRSSNVVLACFNQLMAEYQQNPPKQAIAEFISDNFSLSDQMELWTPQDWTAEPKFAGQIENTTLQKFVLDLNVIWKVLSRKISDDVLRNPESYSLIYLPHPVVVPGGRFREIYYWDSYWILKGLYLCDMHETAKGILLNFVHMIQKYGLIPNGGRTYYVKRSQPPMFTMMVKDYVEATGDVEFVRENITYMAREFEYWLQNHFVQVKSDYKLARFVCKDPGPRPESYLEDFELAEAFATTVEERENIYLEMKTGAATGWDYSSRWMIKDANDVNPTLSLQDTKPRFIIPVDLNSILAADAKILGDFYKDVMGNDTMAEKYLNIHEEMVEAMDAVLWHQEDGVWYDYDLYHDEPRRAFTVSNYFPLWTDCLSKNIDNQAAAAVANLDNQGLDQYLGGVPTTFTTTGQQWDFPNAWPPMEHMLVQGLERTKIPRAQEMAFAIAEKRVRGCLINFLDKGHMYEKYDVSSPEKVGFGGEYEVQLGFGWTNGVVLDFIKMYGDRLGHLSELASPKKEEETQQS